MFLCTHFLITPFSEVEICQKVFNRPEFHFSEVYFFQTWYFNSLPRIKILAYQVSAIGSGGAGGARAPRNVAQNPGRNIRSKNGSDIDCDLLENHLVTYKRMFLSFFKQETVVLIDIIDFMRRIIVSTYYSRNYLTSKARKI